jgi:hypothetical protein
MPLHFLLAQPDNLLEWGKPIQYEDFQAKPEDTDTAAARIAVSIELGYVENKNGLMTYRIRALMDKSESWMKEEFRKEYIRLHEQGHFDLTYIVAGKLEANFKSKKFTKVNINEIHKIYDTFLEQLNKLEVQYDVETKGGSYRKGQEKWNETIKKELAAMKK